MRFSFVLFLFLSLTTLHAQKKEKKAADITKEEIWIDRFDAPTGKSITRGYWFSYNDAGNNGASSISPADPTKAYVKPEDRNQNNALQFSWKLDKGNYQWEPYVGFGVSVVDSNIRVSIETIKGIAYEYKGARHSVLYQLSSVKDYAHYRRTVPASEEWTTIVIPFTEFKQPFGWGRPVEFNAIQLQALQWMITGKTGDTGTLCIDNVRLLRKLPKDNNGSSAAIAPKTIKASPPIVPKNTPSRSVSDKVEIATWYRQCKAAYSLSFDDGLLSQYQYLFPLLEKHTLKATFYLTSESLCYDPLKTPTWRFGYWHHFADMHKAGHEIGAHSVSHPRLTTFPDGKETARGTLQFELAEPLKTFGQKLPGYKIISFAYPFVDYNAHVEEATSNYYVSARAGGNGFNASSPVKWMDLQSHTLMYEPNRSMETDVKKMYDLQKWIASNFIEKNGGWIIYFAHDVLPFEMARNAKDSWHPVSAESMDTLLSWLAVKNKQNELWVAPVGDVTRYIKERDAVNIILKEESPQSFTFSVTDNLPDDIFNHPLTLKIKVPATWKNVGVEQNGKSVSTVAENNQVVIEAIPDKGLVRVVSR